MRALEFIRDHVTFKLPYDFSYYMKTPNDLLRFYEVLRGFAVSRTGTVGSIKH